jgi:hypothetical protein
MAFGLGAARIRRCARSTRRRIAAKQTSNFIIEADIMSFFDSIDRVPDLHVGVLDGESFTTPDEGTAQGSVLSPLLGNIYLHYVLDPGSFDFLGFTIFWKRGRTGKWSFTCKTRRGRLTRSIKAVYDWCRGHRHLSIEEQHVALRRRVQGHINCFGVQGNLRSVGRFVHHVRRAWHKWLNRRSQRGNVTWERFLKIVERYPLPTARVVVASWAT